jgi:hypothetical protein
MYLATLEAIFVYLRRRPHEEVDVLIQAIKTKTEGPIEGPLAPTRRRSPKRKANPGPRRRAVRKPLTRAD